MFINAKRILMSEVDAGSGNGAASAPSDTPDNVPQAQGGVTMTKADLDAAIAAAAAKAVADAKDSIFAEARRTFTAGKPKPKPDDNAPPATPSQLDPIKLRSLDRALTKAGLAERLSDSQYQRAEKAFASEDPSDVEAWIADYFHGFGAAQPSTPSQAPAQPAAPAPKQPSNAQPASDRGSPPPSRVPVHEMNLLDLSESDRAALLKEKGAVWYRKKLGTDLAGRQIKVR